LFGRQSSRGSIDVLLREDEGMARPVEGGREFQESVREARVQVIRFSGVLGFSQVFSGCSGS
jgi:hypothetical protein